jgi:hypothetical protein
VGWVLSLRFEDALLKISVVISDLFWASGQRFVDALVAGERSPKTLAALGDRRLRASTTELQADRHAPAADRRDQRRDRPPGRPDRGAAGGHPRGSASLHRLRADRRRARTRSACLRLPCLIPAKMASSIRGRAGQNAIARGL